MGSAASKSHEEPEQETGDNPGETTFFAPRDSNSPVVFSESIISHLSSATGSTSNSTSTSANRQSTLDAHIQSRIASELTRLRADEAVVREQIEAALERENLDRERGSENAEETGVSHSVSLMRDLEMLEERVERTRNESKKAKENVAWSVVEEQKIDLEKCLQGNLERPLDCQSKVTAFVQAVAGVESAFVAALP